MSSRYWITYEGSCHDDSPNLLPCYPPEPKRRSER